MLEFVANNAPSPCERKKIAVESGKEVPMVESEKPSLFVFKTSVESHVGEITYFKVMSGKITEGLI